MHLPLQWKQMLVGTRLGGRLELHRQHSDLRASIQGLPEKAGMVSQSACAKAVLPYLCDPRSTFVDIGAHIGSVLGAVQRQHPDISLVAVEAVPAKAEQLAANFPTAVVHPVALGASDGTVSFYVDEQRPGYSSLSPDRGDVLTEIQTPMRRLDDLLCDSESISCIKVDVEGHELGVFQGGRETLATRRPAILFESGPRPEEEQHVIHELYDLLADLDYELLVPNRVAHNGPALGRDGFFESHFYPFRTLDYFAVPTEARRVYRDRARLALGL